MMSMTTTTIGSPSRPSPPEPMSRVRRCAVRAQAGGVDASDKSVEIMRKFSEQYARRSNTLFCADKSVTAVVIKGLADHKDQLGAPLCPCIMMTKLLRQHKDFGTAHAYQCVRGRNAIACFFLLRTMILLGRTRLSPWRRSKMRHQRSNPQCILLDS